MAREDTRDLVLWPRRHPLVATYVLAAAIRVAAIVLFGHASGADTIQYRDAAEALRRSLLDGEAFPDLPPVYPAFLALFPSDRTAVVVQALIGALIAPLMYRTVQRHVGDRAAWVTAALAATEPSFVFWSTYLLTETLGLTAFALALERASALADPARRGALWPGAASALAFLTRGAFLLPGVALAAVVTVWGQRPAMRLVTFVLGAGIVLAVPIARNAVAVGEPVAYRDQGLYLVWLGIQWNERGRSTTGVDVFYPEGYATWTREERAQFFREEVTTFVGSRPLEFVGLMAKKLVWLWLPVFPEWSLRHKLLMGGYMSLLYGAALIGLFRLARRRLGALLLAELAALQLTVALTVVDYDNRYRIPAELCLLPFAAIGILATFHLLRRRPPQPWLMPPISA